MNETDHLIACKSSERPSARAPGDDQMATRRDFHVWQAKGFALQSDALVELFNRRAIANFYFQLTPPPPECRLVTLTLSPLDSRTHLCACHFTFSRCMLT
jgi:hypothetical protein